MFKTNKKNEGEGLRKKKSITDIVRESGLHHNTIRSYLGIIEKIQSSPKVVVETTGHSYKIYLVKKSENKD